MGVAETVEGFGELRPGNSIWNHKGITILRMGGGGGVQNEGYVSKVRMEKEGGRVGEGGKDAWRGKERGKGREEKERGEGREEEKEKEREGERRRERGEGREEKGERRRERGKGERRRKRGGEREERKVGRSIRKRGEGSRMQRGVGGRRGGWPSTVYCITIITPTKVSSTVIVCLWLLYSVSL